MISGNTFRVAAFNFFKRIFMGFFTNLGSLLLGKTTKWSAGNETRSKAFQEVLDAGTNDETYLGDLLRKYTGSNLTTAEMQANAFNASEAQKQRDFEQSMFNQQTELANTAYQRQVADMQAAGLNPLMAAGSGNGSAIPSAGSGSAASSVAPSGAALNLGSILSAFSGIKAANADAKLKEAQADSVREATRGAKQQNDYFEEVREIRKAAEQASLDLTEDKRNEIKSAIEKAGSEIALNAKKAENLDKQGDMFVASSLLSRVNAENIEFMREYLAAESRSRTQLNEAQRGVALVDAMYRQHMLDYGVIEAGVRAQNAEASDKEVQAKTREFSQSVRDGSLIKKSNTWLGKVAVSIMSGVNMASAAVQSKF